MYNLYHKIVQMTSFRNRKKFQAIWSLRLFQFCADAEKMFEGHEKTKPASCRLALKICAITCFSQRTIDHTNIFNLWNWISRDSYKT